MKLHYANNLHEIEPGLRLYTDQNCNGIEVPCRVTTWGRQGAIGILAIDQSGRLVVIECKHKYADAMAFGQVLGYLAWMKAWLDVRQRQGHMAKVPAVRAYIVALRASSMLRFLMMAYPEYDITLFETEPILTVDPGANMAYRTMA